MCMIVPKWNTVLTSRAAVSDYAKIQALATLSLAETLREVAGQVPEVAHQIALTSRR